jgi:hypothetical protein
MNDAPFSFPGVIVRCVLSACALCIAGMLVAQAAADWLPASVDRSLITTPNCVFPCTFGIVPGDTDRAQAAATAERLADEVFADQSDTRLAFRLVDHDGYIAQVLVTFGYMQNRRVGAFGLFKDSPQVDIGQLSDLILAGYTPNNVFRSCDGATPRRMLMTFGEADRLMVEFHLDGDLDFETDITLLEVYAPNARTLGDARASFGCSVETGWLGFAPLWRYFNVL